MLSAVTGVIEYGLFTFIKPFIESIAGNTVWILIESQVSTVIAKKDVNAGTINNESLNDISK